LTGHVDAANSGGITVHRQHDDASAVVVATVLMKAAAWPVELLPGLGISIYQAS
jgi:hypothetical protein